MRCPTCRRDFEGFLWCPEDGARLEEADSTPGPPPPIEPDAAPAPLTPRSASVADDAGASALTAEERLRWEQQIDRLLARLEDVEDSREVVNLLHQAARVYLEKLQEPEMALEVLTSAFRHNTDPLTAKTLTELARAAVDRAKR